MMSILSLLLSLNFWGVAQNTTTAKACAEESKPAPLDNFCPRLEGVNLTRCCSPENVKKVCVYHKGTMNRTGSLGCGEQKCVKSPMMAEKVLPLSYRGDSCCFPCPEPPAGYEFGSDEDGKLPNCDSPFAGERCPDPAPPGPTGPPGQDPNPPGQDPGQSDPPPSDPPPPPVSNPPDPYTPEPNDR